MIVSTKSIVEREHPCGEGIYPRWTAQQTPLFEIKIGGPLRDPSGMNPLTTFKTLTTVTTVTT
ncbi:hypothetical protein EMIT093MI4_30454 [Pseudomonas sp. IT-93MI4]